MGLYGEFGVYTKIGVCYGYIGVVVYRIGGVDYGHLGVLGLGLGSDPALTLAPARTRFAMSRSSASLGLALNSLPQGILGLGLGVGVAI